MTKANEIKGVFNTTNINVMPVVNWSIINKEVNFTIKLFFLNNNIKNRY